MQALKGYGLNDRKYSSYGQEGSAATGELLGKIVGGVYNTTLPALNAGDFGRLQMDVAGAAIVSPYNSIHSNLATITVASAAIVGTLASTMSGLTRRITMVTPAMTGTGTATLHIIDSKGGTILTLAAQDESVITNYGTVEPLSKDMSFLVTASETQSADAAIILDVHLEG